MNDNIFLNRSEAAKVSRVSLSTIDHAIRAGLLPVCRPGVRRVVIERKALMRWLRSTCGAPQHSG